MKPNHESASQRYTLNCRMNQEAAALERLCRVVRVRGFRISGWAWNQLATPSTLPSHWRVWQLLCFNLSWRNCIPLPELNWSRYHGTVDQKKRRRGITHDNR